MALGLTHELEYCILLVFDLGFIDKIKYEQLYKNVNEFKAKLINLIRAIRNDNA